MYSKNYILLPKGIKISNNEVLSYDNNILMYYGVIYVELFDLFYYYSKPLLICNKEPSIAIQNNNVIVSSKNKKYYYYWSSTGMLELL